MITVSVNYRDAGTPTDGREVVDETVEEFPEFTWASTHAEATERIVNSVEENDRAEITARTPNGTLVGILVLVEDHDDQVGPVLGAQWNFVSADYRYQSVGPRMFREALKVAKRAKFKLMAYTHRIGEGRYEINYRRIQ